MKTIEQAAEAYAIGLAESNVSPHKPKIEIAIDAFKDGFRLAEEWISVKDELPEIGNSGFSDLVLTKDIRGLIKLERYDFEYKRFSKVRYDALEFRDGQVTHWRPINRK